MPPPYARYPYVRPIPVPYGGGYRPRPYVYAPTTVTVNRTTVNRPGYPGYQGGATPRPTPYQPVARPPAAGTPGGRPSTGALPGTGARPPGTPPASTLPAGRPTSPSAAATQNARPAQSGSAAQRPAPTGSVSTNNYGSRGYSSATNVKPSERAQTSSNAFTGYQNGGAERAASQRGQGSVSRQGSAPGPRGGNPGTKR